MRPALSMVEGMVATVGRWLARCLDHDRAS
jgi:hypothetical protein